MNPPVAGALAGFTATIPMTVAMEAIRRQLPPSEQYPLYPYLITRRVAQKTGVDRALDEPEREVLTAFSHFGYGTAAGAVYGAVAPALPLPPLVKGIGFGLALWAAGYLGWLPALGILPPATEYPRGRRRELIASHIIYGAVAGLVLDCLGADR